MDSVSHRNAGNINSVSSYIAVLDPVFGVRSTTVGIQERMITAVLFDLDGVLADTLHYHFLAWRDKFAEWGGTVSEHTVLLHEGRNSREILPILMEEAGITIPEDQYHSFIENKREYYRSIVRMTFFPQAFETVAAVRARGFKTALVTASALKNMKTAVPPSTCPFRLYRYGRRGSPGQALA